MASMAIRTKAGRKWTRLSSVIRILFAANRSCFKKFDARKVRSAKDQLMFDEEFIETVDYLRAQISELQSEVLQTQQIFGSLISSLLQPQLQAQLEIPPPQHQHSTERRHGFLPPLQKLQRPTRQTSINTSRCCMCPCQSPTATTPLGVSTAGREMGNSFLKAATQSFWICL